VTSDRDEDGFLAGRMIGSVEIQLSNRLDLGFDVTG